MNHYFIKIDYQPEFGISGEELMKRVKENRIPSNALVRKVDSTEWKPLSSYPDLMYTTPPPLEYKKESFPQTPNFSANYTNKKRTSILAVSSLICGIISFGGATIFSAIPAIVLGHMSLRKIKNEDNLKGAGLANSGIVLGYLCIFLIVIVIASMIFPAILKALEKTKGEKSSVTDTSLQLIEGPKNNYSFKVPSDWSVQDDTAGFDSLALTSSEIFGVIVQDYKYTSMSDLVDEVINQAQTKGAFDIELPGSSIINGLDWTKVKFTIMKDSKLSYYMIYLLSHRDLTFRLAYTSINKPLEDRTRSVNQIIESFKLSNP
jgi:hypothetical protein